MTGILPRPGRPIRLVALDIDGTLIGEDLVLPGRVRDTIREVVARGVPVTLATGRMATSARSLAGAMGITLPLIAMQGAVIRAAPAPGGSGHGRLLDHRALPRDVALAAIDWAESRGFHPHCSHLEEMIVQQDDPLRADYERFEFARVHAVADLRAWVRGKVTKVIAVAPPPAPARALAAARAAFAGRADVTISHPLFMEFVAPGVNKGAALRRLARRLGVPMCDVLAAGDQLNDLEMITAAGWGVAMPHAPAEVQRAARVVAPPLQDGGIATILEALVLR